MYYDIAIFHNLSLHHRMHRQCYGSENFSQHYSGIKKGPF